MMMEYAVITNGKVDMCLFAEECEFKRFAVMLLKCVGPVAPSAKRQQTHIFARAVFGKPVPPV